MSEISTLSEVEGERSISQRQASRWRVHVRKNYLYQEAHCKNQNANRIADQTMSFEELLLFVRTRQTMANANDTAQTTVNQPGTVEPIWRSCEAECHYPIAAIVVIRQCTEQPQSFSVPPCLRGGSYVFAVKV